MTDLHTSLFVVGGAFLVCVVFYNKWQEYKERKSLERAFSDPLDNVVAKFGKDSHVVRHEPIFDAETSVQPVSKLDETVLPVHQGGLPIDDLIDCVIPISLESPMPADILLSAIQHIAHVGNKPVSFIGEDSEGNWAVIAYGGVYRSLLAGIQLANLDHPLNEIEYSEWITRLRQIADALEGELELPDMREVIDAARSLHQFVTKHDAKLGINLQTNDKPWVVSTLMDALERQGFDTSRDGHCVMPDRDGGLLFSLFTNTNKLAETTERLTLLLDVPRVAPERDGYGAMVACAKALAMHLGGILVDDSNMPLSETQLTEIAVQVDSFYNEMESVRIPAGSIRALRLFS